MNYQEQLNEKERTRREALETQDPLKYFNLCEQLGIPPEDRDLFELGQAESQQLKQIASDLEEITITAQERDRLEGFLREGLNLRTTNPNELSKYRGERIDILVKYFQADPESLKQLSNQQVGLLYEKKFNEAEAKLKSS